MTKEKKQNEIKRKKPLKRTPLKRTPLNVRKTPLKRTPLKAKKTPVKKVSKKKQAAYNSVCYRSIFTDDLDCCYMTGSSGADPHHIFGSYNKRNSEIYGFMLPLRRDWHEGTDYSIHQDREFDIKIKMLCEKHWIEVLKKTKEEWIATFNKWWDKDELQLAN